MSLPHVAAGVPHVAAHNDERDVINDLLLSVADLDATKQDAAGMDTAVSNQLANGANSKAALAVAVGAEGAISAEAWRVDRKDINARAVSAGQAALDYANGVETTENWTNLTGVTAPANAQVSGNKFFAVSAASPGGWNKTKSLSLTQPWRLETLLYYKAGGPAGNFAFFGINCGVAGQAVLTSDPNSIMIGIYDTNIRRMSPGTGALATAINVYGPASIGVDPTVDTTYQITIEADSEDISFTMRNVNVPEDITIWSFEKAALTTAGKTINNLACFLVDNRGLAGSSFAPWVLTEGSIQPPRTKVLGGQTIHGQVEIQRRRSTGVIASNNAQVYSIPKDYDPRKPSPVVLWAHQSLSGSAWDLWEEDRMRSAAVALNAAGYIIAGINDPESGGGWSMGNARSEAEYLDLYNFLRANYNIGPLFWYAASMGGLDVANAVGRNVFPTPAAVATVGGAFDIGYVWDLGGSFRTIIEAAWSAVGRADLLNKSVGYDPIRRIGPRNKAVPWRIYTSAGDTTQPSTNEETYKTLIAPYAAEATTVYGTGGHLDASQFQGSDLVTFFNKYR